MSVYHERAMTLLCVTENTSRLGLEAVTSGFQPQTLSSEFIQPNS